MRLDIKSLLQWSMFLINSTMTKYQGGLLLLRSKLSTELMGRVNLDMTYNNVVQYCTYKLINLFFLVSI